ncbi:uncharacterized protein LOC120084615 [Benincasa hispida]|uniref:uncharacterized protein LOC120084615 n=1 Tax=Benincasa hispida TaxID=102211 RepID=UPI00190063A3|nr:uncharacterized protein LOC120084615 [Benincasa hispida]
MSSQYPVPKWASTPCIMGIDEAGGGPILGLASCSYDFLLTVVHHISISFTFLPTCDVLPLDSKTLKEEKKEELFEDLKSNETIGWAVNVIDPRELSSKMLNKSIFSETFLLGKSMVKKMEAKLLAVEEKLTFLQVGMENRMDQRFGEMQQVTKNVMVDKINGRDIGVENDSRIGGLVEEVENNQGGRIGFI